MGLKKVKKFNVYFSLVNSLIFSSCAVPSEQSVELLQARGAMYSAAESNREARESLQATRNISAKLGGEKARLDSLVKESERLADECQRRSTR